MEEFDTDLDISWIHEHEKEICINKNYSREPMKEIMINYVYINCNSEVKNIVSEIMPLSTPIISKEMVLHCIQTRRTQGVVKYKLMDIIQYIVDIEPENIQQYAKNDHSVELFQKCRKVLPFYNEIEIPESIFIFHKINALYFFFMEVDPGGIYGILKGGNKTRKSNPLQHHNKTKKVMFNDDDDDSGDDDIKIDKK